MKKLLNGLTNFSYLSNRVTELQARLIRGKWKKRIKCCCGNFKGRGYLGYLDVDRKKKTSISKLICVKYVRCVRRV
jgi:hypothetical protein